MGTAREIGSVDEHLVATSQEHVGEGPLELPEPPERLYLIRVEGPVTPSDPALAAAMDEVYETADRDPNRSHNNPEKKRAAVEGWRELLDEWQAENGHSPKKNAPGLGNCSTDHDPRSRHGGLDPGGSRQPPRLVDDRGRVRARRSCSGSRRGDRSGLADASRQALLSRSLNRCDEVTLDGSAARASGQLCGRTGPSDVIDASTSVAVLEATHRDVDVALLTSDSRDMNVLLSALNISARVIDV